MLLEPCLLCALSHLSRSCAVPLHLHSAVFVSFSIFRSNDIPPFLLAICTGFEQAHYGKVNFHAPATVVSWIHSNLNLQPPRKCQWFHRKHARWASRNATWKRWDRIFRFFFPRTINQIDTRGGQRVAHRSHSAYCAARRHLSTRNPHDHHTVLFWQRHMSVPLCVYSVDEWMCVQTPVSVSHLSQLWGRPTLDGCERSSSIIAKVGRKQAKRLGGASTSTGTSRVASTDHRGRPVRQGTAHSKSRIPLTITTRHRGPVAWLGTLISARHGHVSFRLSIQPVPPDSVSKGSGS